MAGIIYFFSIMEILTEGVVVMSFNQILLIIIGGGLVVGTLYITIRAIFLPTPTDPTYKKNTGAEAQKGKPKA